jgi:hypothetical protein
MSKLKVDLKIYLSMIIFLPWSRLKPITKFDLNFLHPTSQTFQTVPGPLESQSSMQVYSYSNRRNIKNKEPECPAKALPSLS